MIRLVGPAGAGKTTTGALLARRLGVRFVDLDERFAATYGDISEYIDVHRYAAYATQNVQNYLGLVGSECGLFVLALSSGFMTYANDVHPKYAPLRPLSGVVEAAMANLLPNTDQPSPRQGQRSSPAVSAVFVSRGSAFAPDRQTKY